jgi:hypothetical protein
MIVQQPLCLIGFRGEASLTYKEKLLEAYPSIEIVMWDERLSTMAAERPIELFMFLGSPITTVPTLCFLIMSTNWSIPNSLFD